MAYKDLNENDIFYDILHEEICINVVLKKTKKTLIILYLEDSKTENNFFKLRVHEAKINNDRVYEIEEWKLSEEYKKYLMNTLLYKSLNTELLDNYSINLFKVWKRKIKLKNINKLKF